MDASATARLSLVVARAVLGQNHNRGACRRMLHLDLMHLDLDWNDLVWNVCATRGKPWKKIQL
jgi:hypothetical protein